MKCPPPQPLTLPVLYVPDILATDVYPGPVTFRADPAMVLLLLSAGMLDPVHDLVPDVPIARPVGESFWRAS